METAAVANHPARQTSNNQPFPHPANGCARPSFTAGSLEERNIALTTWLLKSLHLFRRLTAGNKGNARRRVHTASASCCRICCAPR